MKEFTMVQWINLNWNYISASLFCIVRKKCPIVPPVSGLMAGRQAGRQTKYWWISQFLKLPTVNTIWTFILINITIGLELDFGRLLPRKGFKGILKCKKFCCHFFLYI